MLWDNLRPEVRQRLTAHRQMIEDVARRHGVDPNFVLATISAESSGRADAVGDSGRAGGLYQVQKAFTRDYGMTDPAQRFDPVASTHGVVPRIGEMLRKSGGDWAKATALYMRGMGGGAAINRRIDAGEAPELVFGNDVVGLARYREAQRLQRKYAGAAPQAAVRAAPSPATPPAALQGTAQSPMVADFTGGGGFIPLPQSTPVRRVPGMGAAPNRAAENQRDLDNIFAMFGIDRLV